MDRIPERLRTAAEGVAKATQMMADAKSKRNGDGSSYSGLKPEQTAEWKAAEMIERYEAALRKIARGTADEQYPFRAVPAEYLRNWAADALSSSPPEGKKP
jgi:hypothetical protein